MVGMVPEMGPDGIPSDLPIVSYTEKVLEEKELELRRYIEDNYSKIRNVERELAELAWQVKLTAGPKKAALELFRKKIELSTEKIKSLKLKEERAKKVWEAAEKALKDEQDHKQKLCEDLSRLVQESASAQFSRLEELKNKLEALTVHGGRQSMADKGQAASEINKMNSLELVLESSNGPQTTHGNKLSSPGATVNPPFDSSGSQSTTEPALSSRAENKQQVTLSKTQNVAHEARPLPQGQHVSLTKGRGHTAERTKGSIILQKPKVSGETSWTGAGFDVRDVGS